jgi:hypothetical protein
MSDISREAFWLICASFQRTKRENELQIPGHGRKRINWDPLELTAEMFKDGKIPDYLKTK